MTLFKKTTIILSLFLLSILSFVILLNFESASKSVQEQLYQDAKNTATSLSLSLSTAKGDKGMIATMINANFDSGNYAYISLADVENKIIYERKSENSPLDVPQFFIKLLNINAPVAVSNVSAGWSQAGILKVQSSLSYAYLELYAIFKNLILLFILFTIIALAMLYILLRKILQPLKIVQEQAQAITQNKFIIQENIPDTKELKDVVTSMNQMVEKVKAMLEIANTELKKQKEDAYLDKITQLHNRNYFLNKLPEYLKQDTELQTGANILIALNGLKEANQFIGREAVDKLFHDIAHLFTKYTQTEQNALIIRMNGTEFTIFLPGYDKNSSLNLAKNIQRDASQIIESYNLDSKRVCLSIGIYLYNHQQTIAELLSYSDNALAQAKFNNNIQIKESNILPHVMGKTSWRNIITTALEHNKIQFVSYKVIDTQKNTTVYKILTLKLSLNDETSYPYGEFMPLAYQLGLNRKIYDTILAMLFTHPNINLKSTLYSLRLPYEYLQRTDTYELMKKLLQTNASRLPFKLTIGMPDKFVNQNSEQMREYKRLFEHYNIDIGIFEFIGESKDYSYLQDIRPVYIKGESNYFISQTKETIATLKRITDTLNIILTATGVTNMDEVKQLQEKGIYIVQGKVVEEF